MVWQGSYVFHLRLEGKKRIRMSCFFTSSTCIDLRQTGSFSVTEPFLTIFCYVEKRNGILGAIHKLRHTNFMIFLPLPILVTGGHVSETPLPSVTSHILQFLHVFELARHRITVSEH